MDHGDVHGKNAEQFRLLLGWCERNWPAAERGLLVIPDRHRLTTREACNVLWETMIQELRAVQSDVDARRHFTPENKPIRDARGFVADLFPKVIEYRPPELVA